ncbi:hypothetical protein A2W24_04895 [Microgenomates group bacterium RBG_16_45_19]|nr:MAG: hypothetical protein A2W24_04895 [Microgenomates group bacterium RBG_16_45_19]
MDYHLLVHNLPGAQSIFRRYHFNYVITYNASEITPVLSDVERWPIIFRDPQLTIFQNPSLPP